MSKSFRSFVFFVDDNPTSQTPLPATEGRTRLHPAARIATRLLPQPVGLQTCKLWFFSYPIKYLKCYKFVYSWSGLTAMMVRMVSVRYLPPPCVMIHSCTSSATTYCLLLPSMAGLPALDAPVFIISIIPLFFCANRFHGFNEVLFRVIRIIRWRC